jgi:tRNA-splicing ligase RtcB
MTDNVKEQSMSSFTTTIPAGDHTVYLGSRSPIKAWTHGVEVEESAHDQLRHIADLPFVFKHVAVMPDVHAGIGSTVGTVVPTVGAVVPAAVGVDIGCGMTAVRTDLHVSELPDRLDIRTDIERVVPHGRTDNGGPQDTGSWLGNPPHAVCKQWDELYSEWFLLCEKHPQLKTHQEPVNQLGTLGGGNHFLEVCTENDGTVWVMLHSGSRGVGGRIGNYFTKLARNEMKRWFIKLPDANLAYLPEGTSYFDDYLAAVEWAQEYAKESRALMMRAALDALARAAGRWVSLGTEIDCHHNYIALEHHCGRNVLVTRKGAIRARQGDMGIIPGSMGERSFIVRGLGNPESWCSASHGAGRRMSRTQAKKTFTVEDHARALAGVECRADASTLDETPRAYKDLDAVMAAQTSLVEVVTELKQIVCVKG